MNIFFGMQRISSMEDNEYILWNATNKFYGRKGIHSLNTVLSLEGNELLLRKAKIISYTRHV